MLLAGCAQVGAVQAPTAGLPLPVHDFQAARLGPQVYLQFTAPASTSDGVAYTPAKFGALRYQVCVWPGIEQGVKAPQPAPPLPGAGVAVPPQVPVRHPPQPGAGGQFSTPSGALMPPCPQLITLTDHSLALDAIAAKAALVTLALAAENSDGDWAGWSNPVLVSLTPVAPPPRLTHIQLTPDGVLLFWRLPQPEPQAIAIYRQPASGQPQPIAHLPGSATRFLDRAITWNQDYTYWLRSSAGAGPTAAESADSRHQLLRTVDLFPPPVPSGLQVVLSPSGDAVDLSWNAVRSHDLAGYNVYRRLSATGRWQKRNPSPLPTPVFHDEVPSAATLRRYEQVRASVAGERRPATARPAGGRLQQKVAVPPGAAQFAYAVTSIDTAGNESLRSPAVLIPR